MGAWGTGFYSDDKTLDIKDTYLDLLRKKVPPEEAVAQMMEEWKPDRDEECGYLFWLTIALLQWEYGHLPQERREKALAILASGVDEARWAEVRPRDREKRREVMAKLEAKFRSEPEKVKKLRPYTHKRLPWKVGDVISLRMGRMCEAWRGALRHWPFEDLYTAVVVMDIWEQDIGDIYDIPVVALYHWIGAEKATMEDLGGVSFHRGDYWFPRREERKRYLHAVDHPDRRDRLWYDLEKVGHLEALPVFSPEEWAYKKKPTRWGTLGVMLAEDWLLEEEQIPRRSTWNDPEADRERAWMRAKSYFGGSSKTDRDLLEQMRGFLFEQDPEELEQRRQREWEAMKEQYPDPLHQKRIWRAIFGTEMPDGVNEATPGPENS